MAILSLMNWMLARVLTAILLKTEWVVLIKMEMAIPIPQPHTHIQQELTASPVISLNGPIVMMILWVTIAMIVQMILVNPSLKAMWLVQNQCYLNLKIAPKIVMQFKMMLVTLQDCLMGYGVALVRVLF